MTKFCELCQIDCQTHNKYLQHLRTDKHISIQSIHTKLIDQSREIEELKRIIQNLTEQRDQFKSIVEKAATKPNIINNTNTDNSRNITTNINMSPDPIYMSQLKTIIPKMLTPELIGRGVNAVADAIINNVLTDAQGRPKAICTDLARQNFEYRDEKTGETVADPQLSTLRTNMRQASQQKYKNEIHMGLLDQATVMNKKGEMEVDYVEVGKLCKRAKFDDPKVVKRLAQKLYKKGIARIKFEDEIDPNLKTKEAGREEWNRRMNQPK